MITVVLVLAVIAMLVGTWAVYKIVDANNKVQGIIDESSD